MSSPAETMSSVQSFRDFITQRLTAAAVEIFSMFEQTVVRYEEELERQRRSLEGGWKPRIKLHRIENADQPVWEENERWEQERVSSPDLDEPLHIKEEEEEEEEEEDDKEDDDDAEPGRSEAVSLDPAPPRVKDEAAKPAGAPVTPDESGGGTRDEEPLLKYNTLRFMRSFRDERRARSDPDRESNSFAAEEPHHRRRAAAAAASDDGRHVDVNDDDPAAFVLGDECKLAAHQTRAAGERQFLCKLCGKAFRLPRSLCLHMRTHTGEKPHSCEICGKRFRQPSHLLVHKRIHTGEKPYSCETCGQTFRQYGNLFTHSKRHKSAKS